MCNLKNAVLLSIFLLFSPHPLIAEQSLRNKIGEMLIIGFHDKTFHEGNSISKNIKNYHIGGVILFSGGGLGVEKGNSRNIENPSQLTSLTTSLLSYAKAHRLKNEGPLFIGIDQEGGYVSRLFKEAGFYQENISAKELGSINDYDKTYRYSKSLGKYLKSLGINLNFAPVLDLGLNPENFIYKRERCFSNDPKIVFSQSNAFVNGMHENGIITTLKHFPGHGSSFADTHKGMADVTNTWIGGELTPYKKFIENGYNDMIMISHVINQKLDKEGRAKNKLGEEGPVPAIFSKRILIDLLRHQLGFQGVIITDDMTMGAIAEQYTFKDALKNCINAGVDMLILANHQIDQTAEAIEIIEQLVNSGEISAQRIDQSYKRIIKLKNARPISEQLH